MDTRAKVIAAARRHGVPEDLALDIAHKESRFNQGARSPKGAIGVMQLMPGTASDLGVNPHDEDQNIDGGVRYIGQQLKDFGGDRTLAMAAYNAGPGNVRKYGGVPPFKETQNYVGADMNRMPTAAELLRDGAAPDAPMASAPAAGAGANAMPSASELLAGSPPPGPAPVPQLAPAAPYQGMKSEALGFKTGIANVAANLAPFSPANLIPGFRDANAAAGERLKLSLDRQAQEREPGKVGRFAGDVLSTSWIPGGPVKWAAPFVQGGLSGAALSEADDAKGVGVDALFGGLAGGTAKYGLDAVGGLFGKALSKAPSLLTMPQMETAKREAYAALKQFGVTYTPASTKKLAADLSQTMADLNISAKRHPKVADVLDEITTALKGKKPLTMEQVDQWRQVVWRDAAGLKGVDNEAEAMLGQKIIDGLDDFMDNATATLAGDGTAGGAALRVARDLNKRWRKMQAVTNKLDSAELRASTAYTGQNVDNTIRQKFRPMIDPEQPRQQLRGATPDEKAGVERIAKGGFVRNRSREVGSFLDPRKLGGKILAGGGVGGALTGGMDLKALMMLVPGFAGGLTATTLANRMAQKDVQQLLRLISAGGSKEALKRAPTAASKTVARATAVAAPLAVAPAVAVARPPQKRQAR